LNAQESIGPWQIFEKDLYFATTFPDSASNKGAFGRFDTGSRSYEMQVAPELAALPATAIFVNASHIYLGFQDRLAIIERGSRQIRVVPFAASIHAILFHNGRLYVGTSSGLTIFSGEQSISYFIHPDGPQLLERL
jgi:hypothetical protein